MIHYYAAYDLLVDFEQPLTCDIPLDSVLFSLAKEFRFCGESKTNILTHSISVGKAAERLHPGHPRIVQLAYVHDLPEHVTRDVPSPLKKWIGERWYAVETEITRKVFQGLGLPDYDSYTDEEREAVKVIDTFVCYGEIINEFGGSLETLYEKELPYNHDEETMAPIMQSILEANTLDIWHNEKEGVLNPTILENFQIVISFRDTGDNDE